VLRLNSRANGRHEKYCAKVVGATSSEGFLVIIINQQKPAELPANKMQHKTGQHSVEHKRHTEIGTVSLPASSRQAT